ncbi:MAG: energy transducer TonB [Novosphingobium sp.]
MAYVDARNNGRKIGAGAAVLGVEAAVGLALVTALTGTIVTHHDGPITTYTVPPPKDPPKPPPPTPEKPRPNDTVIDRPDTLIKLSPPTGTIFEPTLTTGDEGTSSLGEARFPEPEVTADPPPLFKPKGAVPKGRMNQWVTTNDYPTNDLRLEHQGRTTYRVTIDAAGAVTDCSIAASSGFPGLDKATCDNVKRRAKFEPATDQNGARVAGSFSGSVAWQIPRE